MANIFTEKLHRLQAAPENIKKRWLIGLSAAAALVVFAIFLISVNDTISDVTGRSSPLSTKRSAAVEQQTSFYKVRKRTAQTILYFQKKFQEKNSITIDLSS
ncbi:MAG: hypothetical protein R3B52_03135 [Candidatus Paceibacterota bacterium]